MNLRPLMDLLRRSWVLIVVLAAAGAGVAGGYFAASPKRYEATTQVFLTTRQADIELVTGHTWVDRIADSYVELITAPKMLQPVVKELGLHESAKHLAGRVEARRSVNTALIDITASDASPAEAALIANTVASQAAQYVRELNTSSSGQRSVELRPVQPAIPPTAPAMQALLPLLLLGLLTGGVLGAVIATLRGRSGGSGGVRLAPSLQTT